MDLEQICVVLGLLFLAFWRGDGKEGIFIYLMAGASMIAMGLAWRGSYSDGFGITVSITTIGVGFYCIILAVYNLIQEITRKR